MNLGVQHVALLFDTVITNQTLGNQVVKLVRL